MNPDDTGRRYDAIAEWWDAQQGTRTIGVPFVRRAMSLASGRHAALDVGCGSGGPVIDTLLDAGFRVTGIDVSEALLARAVRRHPSAAFVHADITTWMAPSLYDTIIAWDSIFHVPHASQRAVVEKLCDALAPGGTFLFTAGGVDGHILGEMGGEQFSYSSLTVETYLGILEARRCICVLIDRDQYPENHVVMIGVKPAVAAG